MANMMGAAVQLPTEPVQSSIQFGIIVIFHN
jgi:hypothetical protein